MLANRTLHFIDATSAALIYCPSLKLGLIQQIVQVAQIIVINVLEHLVGRIGPSPA